MADLETGVGPFLAIYLTSVRHWDPATVGLVVATQSIVSVLAQAPCGALVDASRRKKWLAVIGAALIASGCFAVVLVPTMPQELVNQSIIGLGSALYLPAIVAVSLGVVGRARLPARIGRNEAMNHAGNVTFAVTAGLLASYLGQEAIFQAAAVASGSAAIAAATLIRSRDVDDAEARGAAGAGPAGATAGGGASAAAAGVRELLTSGRIRAFVAVAFLFHLANGAMLPLVGQLLARSPGAPAYMSGCIVAAQLCMIPVALLGAKYAARRGRKPVFLVGFAALALRGSMYALGEGPWFLISMQALDAVGAGIFGVLATVVAADLARGTGRFNTLQGVMQSAVGLGAFASNLGAGVVVRHFGHDAGFVCLAGVALVGLAVYARFVPETRVAGGPHEGPPSPLPLPRGVAPHA